MGGAAQSGPTAPRTHPSVWKCHVAHPPVDDCGSLALCAAEDDVDEVLARRHLNARQMGNLRRQDAQQQSGRGSSPCDALICSGQASISLSRRARVRAWLICLKL